MTGAFDAARNAVLALDSAWNQVEPALIGSRAEIATLRDLNAQVTRAYEAELDAAAALLDSLQTRVSSDPLGVVSDLESQVRPRLAAIRRALEAFAREQAQIEAGLAAARSGLEVLEDLHRRGVAARDEALQKVTECAPFPPPPPSDAVANLRIWLDRLAQSYSCGLRKPVEIGLGNWNSALENCVITEQEALDAVRGPVELRAELRGRLGRPKGQSARIRNCGTARSYGGCPTGLGLAVLTTNTHPAGWRTRSPLRSALERNRDRVVRMSGARCARPGCSGTMDAGYCDVCGLAEPKAVTVNGVNGELRPRF